MGRTFFPPATASIWIRRLAFPALAVSLAIWLGAVPASAQLEDQGTSVEGCVGCHAADGVVPVGDINNPSDLHHIDLDPRGPETTSGYRQLNVAVTSIELTASNMIILFSVTDEDGAAVDNIFASDGRFVLARLVDGVDPGDPNTSGNPTDWERLAQESFDSSRFDYVSGADYRYSTSFDPASSPVNAGDTLRGAVEISAGDIPAGNGWCDFDAILMTVNRCDLPTNLHRDIVHTDTCNGCHGVTSDTKLAFHGNDGRTEVEYCVTCHNPGRNPDTSMTNMIHKIHYGSDLTMEWRGGKYDHVTFTRDIDNCTSCHEGDGEDVDNWKTQPYQESCASCHDDVNFEDHPEGNGEKPNNRFCSACHPADGQWTANSLPVSTVHQGVARSEEAASYRGPGNGFSLDSVTYDKATQEITVDFSVRKDGQKVILEGNPDWKTNGGSLNLRVAWSTEDYTNEIEDDGQPDPDPPPTPAQPMSFSALDIGNTVIGDGEGNYQTVIDVSDFGFGNMTVGMDGHPVAQDARPVTPPEYVSIPVRSVFATVNVGLRGRVQNRRQVIDMEKCNLCHDGSGAGLVLHGANRADEMQVCVLCHNPDATDINQRPPPAETLDGKAEETVDIKRMIHGIHSGVDLTEGLVIYGFGGSEHDYSEVDFVGNNKNCLTCHLPGTYSTDDAWVTLPTTVDTGERRKVPTDDLNISPVTSVCSSCHDSEKAKVHMVGNGGSFGSLDENISIGAVPEPGRSQLSLAVLGTLIALAHRRRRQLRLR